MAEIRQAYGGTACFTACPRGWYSEAFSNKDNLIHKESFKNKPTWAFKFHILPHKYNGCMPFIPTVWNSKWKLINLLILYAILHTIEFYAAKLVKENCELSKFEEWFQESFLSRTETNQFAFYIK